MTGGIHNYGWGLTTEVFDGKSWKNADFAFPFAIRLHCSILVNETVLIIAGGQFYVKSKV